MLISANSYMDGVSATKSTPVRSWLYYYRSFVFYGFFLLFLLMPINQALSFASFPSLYHGLLFYWVAQKRCSISFVFLFCVGALFDTLMMRVIGTTFLECALFVSLCNNQAQILSQSSSWMRWFIFAIVLLVYVVCIFCVMALLGQTNAFSVTLLSWLWVVASYPMMIFIVKSVCVEPLFT